MSNSTWINWIEQCIKEKHIKYYEHKKFNNIEVIGTGGFGKVFKANRKQQDFALKSFNLDNSTVKEIVSELKIHREVDFHNNIIRFHGITKTDSNEYLLVLEYADGGTLSQYLGENFPSLSWQDKYKLAYQLSSAIECLHEEGIVHRDLHSNNILIHKHSIKLIDFGLSKRIENSTKTGTDLFGIMPYVDPKGFNSTRTKKEVTSPKGIKSPLEKYKLNKKSDVYSVGVLLWELSSGKRPFDDDGYDLYLAMEIAKGLRENIIEGTPEEYSNLYTKCWDGDPDKRPTIQYVVSTLKPMISSPSTSTSAVITPITPITPPNSKKSSQIVDTSPNDSPHQSQIVDTSPNDSPHQSQIVDTSSNNSPQQSQLSGIIDGFDRLRTEDLDSLDTLVSSPLKVDNNLVSELINIFLKLTDEGKSREQRRTTLEDYLSSRNITMEEIHEWLSSNHTTDSNYTFFLGYLNFSGTGTPLNISKAFDYFYKASSKDSPTAQYYLGTCYEYGFGTTINEPLAFKWYERSVKIGRSIIGKFSLGNCYERGTGIEKDEQIAFNWYQDAANNGHAVAQHHIGNFYRLGIYVKKDFDMAFHYYKLSANGEYSFGISMLGYCYAEGIGTPIDKKKAFDLYLEAASMNNNVAQYNVAVCFNDGIGTKKDVIKAMEWYKKSADNGYSRAVKRLEELNYLNQRRRI